MASGPVRLCILGNSHAACLKDAWDEINADHPEIKTTFFAARGNRLSGLEPDGRALSPAGPDAEALAEYLRFISEGADRVAVEAYDLFLVYGLNLGFPDLARFHSSAVAQALADEHIDRSVNAILTSRLRSLTDKPIYVAHNPMRTTPPSYGDPKPYVEVLALLQSRYTPFDALFVPQPKDTRKGESRTLERFATGSRRLDVGRGGAAHAASDNRHMNAEFGKHWLTSFLTRHLTPQSA